MDYVSARSLNTVQSNATIDDDQNKNHHKKLQHKIISLLMS